MTKLNGMEMNKYLNSFAQTVKASILSNTISQSLATINNIFLKSQQEGVPIEDATLAEVAAKHLDNFAFLDQLNKEMLSLKEVFADNLVK